jgi:hypothetical protein
MRPDFVERSVTAPVQSFNTRGTCVRRGSTSALRRPINGGALRRSNVRPGSAINSRSGATVAGRSSVPSVSENCRLPEHHPLFRNPARQVIWYPGLCHGPLRGSSHDR